MNDIAVGIVFHAEETDTTLHSGHRLEVLRKVNASRRASTPWRGFGSNHNELMARTAARWYVALNPDVQIDAAAIVQLVDRAEAAGLAVAGPAIVSPWGTASTGKRGLPSPGVWLRESILGAARPGRARRTHGGVEASDWLTGACLAIRRDLDLRFDERYFMYFEDAQLCQLAGQLNLRVGICPTVVVTHASGWSASDPLVRRRGVEFARSALRFAEQAGYSSQAMAMAGMLRFGSRLLLHGVSSSQRAAAESIVLGFSNPSLPGLSELADEFNATRAETEAQHALR